MSASQTLVIAEVPGDSIMRQILKVPPVPRVIARQAQFLKMLTAAQKFV